MNEQFRSCMKFTNKTSVWRETHVPCGHTEGQEDITRCVCLCVSVCVATAKIMSGGVPLHPLVASWRAEGQRFFSYLVRYADW
jgi:hypothetical protein